MSREEISMMVIIKKRIRRTRMKFYTETRDEELKYRLFELIAEVNKEINELIDSNKEKVVA